MDGGKTNRKWFELEPVTLYELGVENHNRWFGRWEMVGKQQQSLPQSPSPHLYSTAAEGNESQLARIDVILFRYYLENDAI